MKKSIDFIFKILIFKDILVILSIKKLFISD